MKTLLTHILMVLLLGACGQQTQVREVTVQPGAPTPAPDNRNVGTIDGGGGNTLKGRPLESYRRDPLAVPSVKDLIIPLIQEISKKLLPLAGDMYHILFERAWYFVPIDLKKLPWYDINTPFDTDQGAFQTRKEIWLNSKIFDDMSPEDQAGLVVHELVMGIRRMEFTDSLDRCLANAATEVFKDETGDIYRAARKVCWDTDKGAKIVGGNPFEEFKKGSLSEDDYSNVRMLTSKLTKSLDKVDAEELRNWLAKNKFRDYGKPAPPQPPAK